MTHTELNPLIASTLQKIAQGKRYYDLNNSGLTPDQRSQVRTRLIGEGLVKKLEDNVVELTAEGTRVAELGYLEHLKQQQRAERAPKIFNFITIFIAVLGLIISGKAISVAHQDSQKSEADKNQLNNLERTLTFQQQQLTKLSNQLSTLTTSRLDTASQRKPTSTKASSPSPSPRRAQTLPPQTSHAVPAKAGTPARH